MLNLPIFSQSKSTKSPTSAISTPMASTSNAMPLFFAIPPQMFPFVQNSTTNNLPNSPPNILSPRRPIPSLDEFFAKLDESLGGNGELTRFKNIFEDERITVDQIHDLTDNEFDQLGITKIGWRKAFRAAAKYYK